LATALLIESAQHFVRTVHEVHVTSQAIKNAGKLDGDVPGYKYVCYYYGVTAPFTDINQILDSEGPTSTAPFTDIKQILDSEGPTSTAPFTDINQILDSEGPTSTAPLTDINQILDSEGPTSTAAFIDINQILDSEGPTSTAAVLKNSTSLCLHIMIAARLLHTSTMSCVVQAQT